MIVSTTVTWAKAGAADLANFLFEYADTFNSRFEICRIKRLRGLEALPVILTATTATNCNKERLFDLCIFGNQIVVCFLKYPKRFSSNYS